MPRFIRLPDGTIQPMPESAPEEEPPTGSDKFTWVGSEGRPEAKKFDDGVSDLFEVDTEDDTADLVSVDIDRDIIDTAADGTLDDLTEVSEEDILGDEDTGQIPLDYKPDAPRIPIQTRTRRPIRYVPPTSSGGLR